jgi:hypothetical protein
VERIIHNGNNTKAVALALRWFRIPLVEEINTLISPDGSMYVEPEQKLNIINASLTFNVFLPSNYYMVGGLCLHARENAGSVLSDTEVAHSNSMTLNELVANWFPADGKEHDLEFLSAPGVPVLDQAGNYRLTITVDIKDIMEKINNNFFNAPSSSFAQKYDIYLVLFNYVASQTYYYYVTICIEGRMVLSQSKLI